jgi:predicted dehydrogenase
VARNFADLADLAWLCDVNGAYREHAAARHPDARWTERYEDLLEDRELDAIAIATDVPTHYPLAKQALEAGKHVFVEKPPAMRGSEMDELVTLSEQRDLVLMPGHLLLYHPGVKKLKELITEGTLGEVLYVYGNRQNFGVIRTVENALWSLGVHDLSVILYLLGEAPDEVIALGRDFLQPGVEDVVFCYLRFPSGKIAHMHLSWLDPHKMRRMTVVGKEKMVVFDDMEPARKVTIYENAPEKPGEDYPAWRTQAGAVSSPDVANDEPLKLECEHFLALVRDEGDRRQVARDGAMVVRALERLTESLRG